MVCPRCARTIPDDAALCCYCGRTIIRKTPSKTHQRPNGAGTAYKRKGHTHWTACVTLSYYVDENGKQHLKRQTKEGFKSRAEALKYLETLHEEGAKKPAPPLAAYWDMYAGSDMDKLSESKYTAYKIAWGKMGKLANRRVDTITIADLRACVSDQAKTYYPARDMKIVLQHLFRLAAADGWVNKDLPSYIALPDKNETPRQAFTEDEQKALWAQYEKGDQDAAIPLIMIYTGMMTGEMQRLAVDMIRYDTNEIVGVGLKTKIRKESPVFFPDDIRPVLEDVCAGNQGKVFKINKDNFYTRYYAALERAGCRPLNPYCCRHTTATRLAITKAIAPQTVQKIMRWSSTKMLDRYAHPDNADAIAAINTLNSTQKKTAQEG